MAEELPAPTSVIDVSEPAVEAQATDSMPPPEVPKRKGRPPGSKDTVKRVRKAPVSVRIDPITPAEPEPRAATPRPKEEAAPRSEPPPVVEPPVQRVEVEEPPPTPRSMLRAASRHFVALKSLVQDSRKTELRNMYTHKLTAWPS